jgi:hypothetical protein
MAGEGGEKVLLFPLLAVFVSQEEVCEITK